MHRLEQVYDQKDWATLSWLLWDEFVCGDNNSISYQLAILIYEACSPKERTLMENI